MAEMKFEDALKKLERIVEELENGDLSLESAIGKYEEGVRLSKFCAKKLESAKKKVEVLLKSDRGAIMLEPFDEGSIGNETKEK